MSQYKIGQNQNRAVHLHGRRDMIFQATADMENSRLNEIKVLVKM